VTEDAVEDQSLSREQRSWRWRILIATYFAYAGFYLVRKVFTLCKTTLAKDYGIGLSDSANIWTAYLIGYMLGQFVSSYVGRRWGPRLLLLGGLGTSIAVNMVFAFATSYTTFAVFMFANGLVQAAGWPGTVGAVAEWLREKERGTFMGILSTNYQVGNIVVKFLAGFLLLYFTSRYDGHYGVKFAFLGCTSLALPIWWLIFFWQRTKPEDLGLEPIVDHALQAGRSVEASTNEQVSVGEYLKLVLNPIIPLMGVSYFCIKFLRYALESWLPTFLNLQGMDVGQAAYYSSIFDGAGLAGAIVAGIALDRFFQGRWERICAVMGLGTVLGYLAVIEFGAHPESLAICFGLVGFMLYGPDTLLCGAAAVSVAGQRNGVAVAGLINGIASIGPVIQELVIGKILPGRAPEAAVRITNLLGLSMSIVFVAILFIINLYSRSRGPKAGSDSDHLAKPGAVEESS
jgi:sugar phosphate permease